MQENKMDDIDNDVVVCSCIVHKCVLLFGVLRHHAISAICQLEQHIGH